MKVGVLALQGAFREHRLALERLGVKVVEVRQIDQLHDLVGLIVPGGESTTIGRLAHESGLEQAVRERIAAGTLAFWGTCAGAIWAAKTIESHPTQVRLGVMDISVTRNAYGRQIDSFTQNLAVKGLETGFRAVFIRAPGIESVGPQVEVLASHAGHPVMVRQDHCLASTFHPELSGDDRIHSLFLRLCEDRMKTFAPANS